jgi:hypothetical protein
VRTSAVSYACGMPPGGHKLAGALLAALTLALCVGACGGDDGGDSSERPPAARPQDFPRADGRTIAQLREGLGPGPVLSPAVSVLAPDTENRFGFGLFDRSRKQLADASVALYVAPVDGGSAQGPFLARYESLETKPQFQSESVSSDPDAAESVYVADLRFEDDGEFEVLGVVKLDDRLVAADRVGVTVSNDSPVPDVGEPAPKIDTPTVEDAGGEIETIETRMPPDSMHEVDFADVVGRKPVMLLFSTPALCQSRVCGPVNDVAEQVKAEGGDGAAWVHMEIYEDNELEKGYRPQVAAYNLPSEPWLFAIDRNGKVAARLEGAFSAAEAEKALQAATRGN